MEELVTLHDKLGRIALYLIKQGDFEAHNLVIEVRNTVWVDYKKSKLKECF